MTKYKLALLSTVIISCLSAQQKNTQLHQIFDQYYKESNVLSPLSATFNGIDGYNDQLPADDENQLKKIHDFYIKYIHLLKPFGSQDLNKEDRISLAILENDLQIALKTEKIPSGIHACRSDGKYSHLYGIVGFREFSTAFQNGKRL